MSPSTCREPWRLGSEMLRVTKPGGLVVLSYTVWLGPFGGHEMGLTHYLGGARPPPATPASTAIRPKNNYGSSLFAVSAADGLDFGAGTGALVAAFPRYHPRWAWWMTKVPLLQGVSGEQPGAGASVRRDRSTETGSRFAPIVGRVAP